MSEDYLEDRTNILTLILGLRWEGEDPLEDRSHILTLISGGRVRTTSSSSYPHINLRRKGEDDILIFSPQ